MKFQDTNITSVIREFNLPMDFGTNFQMKNYVLILEIIDESPNRLCVIFEAKYAASLARERLLSFASPTQGKRNPRYARVARIFQNSSKKDFYIDNARLFHFEHLPLSPLTVR